MANKRIVFEVKWKIENLRSWIQTRDDTLYSPQFLSESLGNTRWKLTLSPNWQLAEKYISLALQRDVEDDYQQPIDLNYDLSFLERDLFPIKSKTFTKKFAPKTLSHELNLKQDEFLELKDEDYEEETGLMVCCKMWKSRASISKEDRCLIKSVIGIKTIKLQGGIDTTLEYQTVNFTSTSTDISFISFDVFINCSLPSPNTLTFERNHIDCKRFNWYDCRLFLYNARGKKKCYSNNSDLDLFTSDKKILFLGHNFCNIIYYSQNSQLKTELEIDFSPGVQSEIIEYENSEKNIDNMNTSDTKNKLCGISNDIQSADHDEYYDTVDDESGLKDHIMEQVVSSTIKRDLSFLHDERLFCDTELITDTDTFPAHRCILSARSPVFKKMFTTDMKEKAVGRINVPDISSDTARRLLQFLYTDSISNLEMQSAKDLYVAAEKYDIISLKQSCSFFMKKNLRPSNVCEVLVLADMHQDKDLESAAQEYVLANDEEVFDSDEWKSFMKDYSAVAIPVMYLKCLKK